MEARRNSIVGLALALALALAGCGDEASQRLKDENERLVAQLNQQAGHRAAEIAYFERQAAVAAGCDWLIQVCPPAVVEPGRKAQQSGFGGGSDWPFWAAVLAKLAAAGAFTGSLLGFFLWIGHRLARPEAAAVERARELLETAEKSAQEAAKRATEAQTKWREMEHLINQQKTALVGLESEIEGQKREIESMEAAKNALRAFD